MKLAGLLLLAGVGAVESIKQYGNAYAYQEYKYEKSVDCVMARWGEWTRCSQRCGSGVQYRMRDIIVQQQGNGRPCKKQAQERDCNTHPCPVECDFEWGTYTDCSRSCGGGTQYREVKVKVHAAYGGKACPQTEERSCKPEYCPQDCEVSEWGEWSACSEECGAGVKYREREVLKAAAYGGKQCPYGYKDQTDCFDKYCPVNCAHEFGEWSSCSQECGGGYQTREPNIITQAAYGGKECPGTEQKSCNEYPCAVECIVSEWVGWSDCSEYCGDGVQHNSRTIVQEPAYGGKACPYLNDERNCKVKECPVDCQAEWGTWGDCSMSCGGGYQQRVPLVHVSAAYGGKECPQTEERECNTDYCPIDCQYSRWGKWSDCSEYCGEGVKYKERHVTVKPQYGGKHCPSLHKERNCFLKYCPIDCDYQWGEWSECSKTCGGGYSERYPKIATAHAHGGQECPGKEDKACYTDECPVDCYLSDWSDWSACNERCGEGVQYRDREERQSAAYGGSACPPKYEERDCSYGPCAIDCEHEWGVWSECSRSCGGGETVRHAKVLVAASHGADRDAKACPDDEYSVCNTDYCPIDCVMSDWQGWSACSEYCGDGVQYNTREVATNAAYGGQACPPLSEERDCFERYCPVDCDYDYGEWGACSKECGGGYMKRVPDIKAASAYGGMDCPAEEEKACNTDYCAIDCVMSEWSGWSDCSEYCGDGVQYNKREVVTEPEHGGKPCPPGYSERACKVKECPLDCNFDWGPWSECSMSCGGGQMVRQPKVYIAHAYGGKRCPEDQYAPCATEYCPVDCAAAAWGEYSQCSEPCGEGVKYRSRLVTQEAAYGGVACPPLTQEANCMDAYCPIDCKYEWGQWSDCDKNCGGGVSYREPLVHAAAAHYGKECPQREEAACNQHPCAIDCVVSDWGSWSDCNEPCGEGVQYAERAIRVQPKYGGDACPETAKEQKCSYGPCAIDCEHEWGVWSECSRSCGGGEKVKSVKVTVQARHGVERNAKSCPEDEYAICNTDYCPVDCQVSEWYGWSDCSEYCGDGVQYNKREISQASLYGGQACPSLMEEQNCMERYCAVHCEYEWGDWSACSKECGGGYKKRVPKVSTEAQYGGDQCPQEEDEACNTDYCPVDCAMGGWGDWSSCSNECDEGTMHREREVKVENAYGGRACGPTFDERNCNYGPCAVDCVHAWGAWGECSKECGGGVKYRHPEIKVMAQYGGKGCPQSEEAVCNEQYCPVDCQVSEWAGWSKCSEECGDGVKYNTRDVTVQESYGGKACPYLREEANCMDAYCAVDCQYEWGDWSGCSRTCGGGYASREPKIYSGQHHGGSECPQREEQTCNTEYCAVDCTVGDWDDWGECSEKCGEGIKYRTRNVATEAAYGGVGCPATKEEANCDYGPCAVDCEQEWGSWSDCDKTCGGGMMVKHARVTSAAAYGGKDCAPDEYRVCNTEVCASAYEAAYPSAYDSYQDESYEERARSSRKKKKKKTKKVTKKGHAHFSGESAVCTDTCMDHNDGVCDDGGPDSEFAHCALGTDCSDCGERLMNAPPRAAHVSAFNQDGALRSAAGSSRSQPRSSLVTGLAIGIGCVALVVGAAVVVRRKCASERPSTDAVVTLQPADGSFEMSAL